MWGGILTKNFVESQANNCIRTRIGKTSLSNKVASQKKRMLVCSLWLEFSDVLSIPTIPMGSHESRKIIQNIKSLIKHHEIINHHKP